MTALPFSKENDPRMSFAMYECDPRIHFALNCGARSCPPIAVYSDNEGELEDQLKLATESFLENNVTVGKEIVEVSMLFSWYKSDFGTTDLEVLRWIQYNAARPLVDKIEQLLTSCPSPKLKFCDYDWSLNSV